jgi:hypothetical protein
MGGAVGFQPDRALTDRAAKLVEQTGFADPGLSENSDDLPLSARRGLEAVTEDLQLPVPPDERC